MKDWQTDFLLFFILSCVRDVNFFSSLHSFPFYCSFGIREKRTRFLCIDYDSGENKKKKT